MEPGGVSRRGFLQLACAGLATLALPGDILALKPNSDGVDSQEGLCQSEILNPEIWEQNGSVEYGNYLKDKLFTEISTTIPQLREYVVRQYDYDIGESSDNNQNLKQSVDRIVNEASERAFFYNRAKRLGFDDITEQLKYDYDELAQYIRLILVSSDLKNRLSQEEFFELLINSFRQEIIGQFSDTKLDQEFDRKRVATVWNYDWRSYGAGNTVLSPMPMFMFDPMGFELGYKPFLFTTKTKVGNLPIATINHDEDWYTKRPNRVMIFNLDQGTRDFVASWLMSIGLNRSMTSIRVEEYGHLAGLTHSYAGEVVIKNPGEETLTFQQFLEREREYLHIIGHEAYHSLSARRGHLYPNLKIDQLELRQLEMEIYNLCTPLKDMNLLFNPEGDFHGYNEDNYHTLTNYFIRCLLNRWGNREFGVVELSNEFMNTAYQLTTEFPTETLFFRAEDQNMKGYFTRLRDNYESYKGFTKLIVKTLLNNIVDIANSKRAPLLGSNDAEYINEAVIPLTFTHLLLYKTDELISSGLPENLEKDRGVLENYILTLKKRTIQFINDYPQEELLADFFAQAVLTNRYGSHQVRQVNQAKQKFAQILGILKRNSLANVDGGLNAI